MLDLNRFWRQSNRDMVSLGLQFYANRQTQAVAQASFLLQHPAVPTGYCLLIQSWVLRMQAGATQTIVSAHADMVQLGGLPSVVVWAPNVNLPAIAANSNCWFALEHELIFIDSQIPQAAIVFNAGTNPNIVTSDITGFIVPKGMLMA